MLAIILPISVYFLLTAGEIFVRRTMVGIGPAPLLANVLDRYYNGEHGSTKQTGRKAIGKL